VVGFSESRVYCLQQAAMLTLDIPHSATLARFLAVPDFRRAYQACAAHRPLHPFCTTPVYHSSSERSSTSTAPAP